MLASLGHASLRVPENPERFIVKGRGYKMDALSAMRPEDMIVCDLDGYKVEGPEGTTQCFEVKMHSWIYKTHPEVQSVVHVHPRFTVVMSILQAALRPMCQEGADLVSRPIPVYPHVKTVVTDEEGSEVAGLLGDSPVILLEGHGATTTGNSLEASVMTMLLLEVQARMNWYAWCAAGPEHRSIPEGVGRRDVGADADGPARPLQGRDERGPTEGRRRLAVLHRPGREVPLVLPGGRGLVSPCHTSAPGPPDPTQGKAQSS